MPWLSIIMALLSFFTTKKKTNGDTATAVAAGALAGFGTYYATHETDWGRDNLGWLDGVASPDDLATVPTTGVDTTNVNGQTVTLPTIGAGGAGTGATGGFWDSLSKTLTSWGPLGTAGVIGMSGGVLTDNKWLLWGGIAVIALLLLK